MDCPSDVMRCIQCNEPVTAEEKVAVPRGTKNAGVERIVSIFVGRWIDVRERQARHGPGIIKYVTLFKSDHEVIPALPKTGWLGSLDHYRRNILSTFLILGRSMIVLIVLASCNPRMQQAHEQAVPDTAPLFPTRTGADLSAKCFDCHDYQVNHHPIEIAPADPKDYPFPLYDGLIECLTCHTDDHDAGSGKLLRGAPYEDRREICFTCHAGDAYAEIDPHVMLNPEGGYATITGKSACLVCHAITPDPAKDRTRDVWFRADIAFLCWRCHGAMINGRVFEQHFLKEPPLSMMRTIEKNEQERQITIPLVPRDRITCSTCHNPHQKGVIVYGPSAKGADAPGRLRLPEPQICFVCHEM